MDDTIIAELYWERKEEAIEETLQYLILNFIKQKEGWKIQFQFRL